MTRRAPAIMAPFPARLRLSQLEASAEGSTVHRVHRDVVDHEVGSPRGLLAGAPTDPDLQNSRILCGAQHKMRNVAATVMWRRHTPSGSRGAAASIFAT